MHNDMVFMVARLDFEQNTRERTARGPHLAALRGLPRRRGLARRSLTALASWFRAPKSHSPFQTATPVRPRGLHTEHSS